MKKLSFVPTLKALLLAVMSLAFNAIGQNTDTHWSPFDVLDDGNGPYAYFADSANWDSAVVPEYTNSNGGTVRVMVSQADGSHVTCVITNDIEMYQIMIGAGNGGDVVVSNASVKTGLGTFGGGTIWTGVGFPDGPSTLTIGPGASFTCGDHLWIGQGTGNEGSVIIDGGTLRVNGQLGAGWNGTGGTNYVTLMNGGKAFLNTWASPTLGLPGNNSRGIMNLASNNCFVIVTNNQTGFFPALVASGQLIAYGGAGTVTWSYNPVANITTIAALPPTNAFTPIISVQPTNVMTSLGSTIAFNALVSNTPVTYQWLFNGNPLSNGSGISGATTATLTITGVTTAHVGSYSVKATSTSQADQIATSVTVGLGIAAINLYPVVTILGVPGNTYVTSSSITVNGTYTPFATNTLNSFAPFYVVDTTSPLSVTKFYRTVQR